MSLQKWTLSKYVASVVLGVVVNTGSAYAQSCNLSNVFNFSVYAVDSVRAANSDFQGLTGAGNSISVSNFHFGPQSPYACGVTVSVGNYFYGRDGSLDGSLELAGPQARYELGLNFNGHETFNLPSYQYTQNVNHYAVTDFLQKASRYYRALPVTKSASVQVTNSQTTITLGKGSIQVVRVHALQLEGRKILIQGSPSQTLIINVDSDAFVAIFKSVFDVKGLYIRNIIWNFHSAQQLNMAQLSGKNTTYQAPYDGYDTSLGLQGFVLAPQATVVTAHMKITGGIYAQNFELGNGPTSQVNMAPMQGPISPCLVDISPSSMCKPVITPKPGEQPLK